MDDTEISSWLSEIAGCQLSSVAFVMDYLQLDFDGNRYTMYIWPNVISNEQIFLVADQSYKDFLCNLIAHIVAKVTYSEQVYLDIQFENNNLISLPIHSSNPNIVTEIGFYTDANGKWMVFE